jgi:succinate dehydrogenase hydrophobic anchor subunit
VRRFLRDNGLSLTVFGVFLAVLVGQSVVGHRVYDSDQTEHGHAAVSYWAYLQTGAFVEVTFENWESEFLQMAAYVLLTVFLFQRGSVESKDPDQKEATDQNPDKAPYDPGAPWPVRRGGLVLRLYENSLFLAFTLLFLLAFALHAYGGAQQYSEDQLDHGRSAVSTLQYLRTAQFWFESLQNWQSEFLAVGAIVALSVFLRQKGSPESKSVAAPHSQTGD